jgi:membrane fusion protein, multidrug efflux system
LLKNAQLDLQRYQDLLAQDSIAEQQVATQKALVRQYEGSVLADQGQIDQARLQLSYARITAPVDGRTGLRQTDAGNVVRATDANGLVVITQEKPITVIFSIPQDSLSAVLEQLRSGGKLPVQAYSRDQKTRLADGVLLTADNQIDTSTGTVRLKAAFPNEQALLFPNQFVNIRMLLEVKRNVVLVPSTAIQRGAQGSYVYVVKSDKTVSLRWVKLGNIEGETTAIEHGVSSGDTLVVDGTDNLREGMSVEPILPAPAPVSDDQSPLTLKTGRADMHSDWHPSVSARKELHQCTA